MTNLSGCELAVKDSELPLAPDSETSEAATLHVVILRAQRLIVGDGRVMEESDST